MCKSFRSTSKNDPKLCGRSNLEKSSYMRSFGGTFFVFEIQFGLESFRRTESDDQSHSNASIRSSLDIPNQSVPKGALKHTHTHTLHMGSREIDQHAGVRNDH